MECFYGFLCLDKFGVELFVELIDLVCLCFGINLVLLVEYYIECLEYLVL